MISLQENESVSFCLNRVYVCKKTALKTIVFTPTRRTQSRDIKPNSHRQNSLCRVGSVGVTWALQNAWNSFSVLLASYSKVWSKIAKRRFRVIICKIKMRKDKQTDGLKNRGNA